MKAEIVTFVRAYNYGAVLQCYALSKTLENIGIQPEVLDYDPAYFATQYLLRTEAPIFVGFRPLRRWLLKLYGRSIAWKRSQRFVRFLKRNLPLSPRKYHSAAALADSPPDCDCYITGSDQVWSPWCAQFDPVFFLDFPDARKKNRYSYAASFGVHSVPEDKRTEYITRLSGFEAYSVREHSGADLLRELLDQEAAVCCDPTLLLTPSEWASLGSSKHEKRPYILVYYVAKTQTLQEYAKKLAAEKNMKVICIPTTMLLDVITGRADRKHGFDIRTACPPEEMLALFRDAEYVLTNSFHGTVFSILFHRRFLVQTTLGSGEKNTRALELMAALGIENRELETNFSAIDRPLPWPIIDEKRESLKNQSVQYLRRIKK